MKTINVNFFNASIPVLDCRNGYLEDRNGGHYVWREQFNSPMPSVYKHREIASFHGDLQPLPEWEEVTLSEFISLYKQAVKMNRQLSEDLRI